MATATPAAPKSAVAAGDKQAPNALTPPAAPASTAPGTADEGGKKRKKKDKGEKVKRVKYPNVPEDGLDTWPADFDPKVNKPLRRQDFKDETVWLERKAEQFEKAAARMRDEAKTIKSLGTTGERGKARKLLKISKELESLKEVLKAKGVDVEALLNAAAQ